MLEKRLYTGAMEQFFENSAAAGQTPVWSAAKTRIYIGAPDGVCGVFEHDPDATAQASATRASLLLTDYLGSIDIAVDFSSGSVLTGEGRLQKFSYDPWGGRRKWDDWNRADASTPGQLDAFTDHGFTGHETMDELGLVHMNARIYDPLIGRFLSPDSVLQFPGNIQSYDRYQYVLNNPCTFTDPSGHLLPIIVGIILVAAEAGIYTSVIVMAITSAAWAAINGAQGADIWKAGLMAAAMTAVSFGIGSAFGEVGSFATQPATEVARAAAHGITGGVASDIQGGSFASGFAAGFVGSAAGSAMSGSSFFAGEGTAAVFKRTIAAAIIGGTVADIGGGKFANGAMTSAVQHLFNAEMHRFKDSTGKTTVVIEEPVVNRNRVSQSQLAKPATDLAKPSVTVDTVYDQATDTITITPVITVNIGDDAYNAGAAVLATTQAVEDEHVRDLYSYAHHNFLVETELAVNGFVGAGHTGQTLANMLDVKMHNRFQGVRAMSGRFWDMGNPRYHDIDMSTGARLNTPTAAAVSNYRTTAFGGEFTGTMR